ncbi:hypothetical protein DEB41_17485 (plasmid) [Vibrio anguillarum]|uniref:hypothetical protein n=1 Tax=Vibrio anguillarum TaxID=55601 RepID=UPI00097E2086|nr:hypothetical protein [Vibrio anguillarum]QFG06233.1 putative receptor-binding protein [Vibrio phage VAI2]AXN09294.1 hypothetical protein DEA53_17690 [Vibrio anguillarum]AXN12695.1 hypothetical protein DEB26_17440 [Vibrio anguillarum]AXN16098.1 hypothetical protein DEB41_17485 [Vibrio anguillarum]AXN19499.1 hypothetical protein DEB11_17465 [Vibrio anguillarum]
MRSAINTALFILFLLLAFLTSVASYAAVCPIGNTPSLKWPLGTARIASACVNGCRAEEGIEGQNTWTCSDKLQYCTGYFVTTGDTCTGSDDTNGTCDANGTCTDNGGSNPDPDPTDPHYNHVIDGQLAVMPGVISGLDSSSAQLAKALRIGAYMNAEVAKSTHIISPLLADLIDVSRGQSNILSNMANKNTPNYSETLHSILSTLHSINNNSGGSVDVTSIKNSIDNSLVPNSYILNNNIQTMTGRLDNIKNSLDNNHNSQTNFFARKMDELISAVGSSGGGDGGGDNSGVINALNNQTTELKGGLNSLGQGIDSLNDALSTGSYVSREFKGKVDFDAVGLYKPDLLESVLADTEELKQQYEQQIDEFKKIFSFDVSQLNSGQYKEHSLDFVLPNGKQLNLKSGVLPAFIDQANLIAAVILFVAAIIAVKAILGSRK